MTGLEIGLSVALTIALLAICLMWINIGASWRVMLLNAIERDAVLGLLEPSLAAQVADELSSIREQHQAKRRTDTGALLVTRPDKDRFRQHLAGSRKGKRA